MVAEMAHCEAARRSGDDGDGDVHTSDCKEHSGTSVADSEEGSGSEEDEEDRADLDNPDPPFCLRLVSEANEERDEKEEEVETGEDSSQEVLSEPASTGEEVHLKSQCDKCKAAQQSSDYEKVTPRKISKGRLQVQLEGEGTYECSATGLVFEVSEQALVRYSVLSWSKFDTFLTDSWKFAGPIFNVDVVNKDASVLKSILFPHSLCLADPQYELQFSVLHVQGSGSQLEPSAEHTGSHVRWRVSSLSPVGPVVQSSRPLEHHGVVLVYKELGHNNTFSFRVYLASNNSSDIKDIGTQVRSAQKSYRKIDKPPVCNLDVGKYHLVSQPEGEINPKELKFTFEIIKLKGYFEAFFEQPPPFKLSLKETTTDETVWSATIREGDCEDVKMVFKPKQKAGGRKRSSSTSEEEMASKKPCCLDESDGNNKKRPAGRDLSDKQLLQVAKTLGKEWEQAAIHLELSITDLDDIKADRETDVAMQKLKMLALWKRRRPPGKATAQDLLRGLEYLEDLPVETHLLLTEMVQGPVK
ncbi:uncharacterized protein LOC132475113 isoform X3 [Gadus macrocephalus]|uniref:uncharacterized protein LOC132475113 isoform X3 n=1 Tax=Gadus macrocephalus TaxID=80720 RepID=UPI0028CBAD39|nr:uncharacterized protein LOC132475113 isoform X3 [Gadus macrocephalus]